MSSIYITGDIHRDCDIDKLTAFNFPDQEELTKDDYLIVCGDFGMVWDDSGRDLYWRKWCQERNFTTLFVDGNHENFDLLKNYPVTEWNGGSVQIINDSIIHLMRGQVYTINGAKFFTFGGGKSVDMYCRKEGKSWWPEEQPSDEEFTEADKNLEENNWKVDYVISHTTSLKVMHGPLHSQREHTKLNEFFDDLEVRLDYKHWYFGHFHRDKDFDDYKCSIVFQRVIKLM